MLGLDLRFVLELGWGWVGLLVGFGVGFGILGWIWD